jgi:hypothetical protein
VAFYVAATATAAAAALRPKKVMEASPFDFAQKENFVFCQCFTKNSADLYSKYFYSRNLQLTNTILVFLTIYKMGKKLTLRVWLGNSPALTNDLA